MRFLFIVQGEGRGHFTQAISMYEMLQRHGHNVVEVLVGKSNVRDLPDFFTKRVDTKITRFLSPNFAPSPENKRVKIDSSIMNNIRHAQDYMQSIHMINQHIKSSKADVVINFYEMLTGMVYMIHRPRIPYVCIGHQYLFMHKQFSLPVEGSGFDVLKYFTRFTSVGAAKRLALSFYPFPSDKSNKIDVVPPILRSEVLELEPEQGEHIHGYMLNSGFSEDVEAFHKMHPEVPMHFFWDKKGAAEETVVDDTLTYHKINDKLFLEYMRTCKCYASTAGFESICEAMYLGKPVMMIPAHIEQDCNAADAMRAGAGFSADSFDLERLLKFSKDFKPNPEFRQWVEEAEIRIMQEILSVIPEYHESKFVEHNVEKKRNSLLQEANQQLDKFIAMAKEGPRKLRISTFKRFGRHKDEDNK